jgi:hypothetical protein
MDAALRELGSAATTFDVFAVAAHSVPRLSRQAVRQPASDFHQRASPAPRAYATNPTTPKCRTALTAAGWGSSRNGLAQIPWMSSGCNLHESARASGLSATDSLPDAVSLPYGVPIGSSSEYSSTDRSTTQFLARVGTDPTPRMLRTSRGSAPNLPFNCTFVRLQCWCPLQFQVAQQQPAGACMKWLKTSCLALVVAICRQSDFIFLTPVCARWSGRCHRSW